MSEAEKRDYWRALAEQMGVDVPPEPEAPEGEPSSASDAKPTEKTEPPRPTPKKRQSPRPRAPANWAGLASELGIEAPEVEADRETPPLDPAVSDSREGDAGAPGGDDRDAAPPGTGDSPFDEFAPSTAPDWLDTDVDVLEPPEEEFDTEVCYDAEAALDDGPAASDVEDAVGEEVAPASEEEGRPTAKRKRRRRGRRKPSADTDRAPASSAGSPDTEEEEEDESDRAVLDETEPRGAAASDAGDEQLKRKRRRRKRSAPKDGGELSQEPPEPTIQQREAAEDETGEDADGNEAPDDRAAADRSKHRKIPTWEEAIGIVVGANMESRTKNPGGGSRGGGSRGRGRGGRRN